MVEVSMSLNHYTWSSPRQATAVVIISAVQNGQGRSAVVVCLQAVHTAHFTDENAGAQEASKSCRGRPALAQDVVLTLPP